MANQKLTQEELDLIQEIQKRMQLAQQELGNLELQKVGILNYVAETRQAETQLVKQLEEAYGVGSIDLEKGEFVPQQIEPQLDPAEVAEEQPEK